MLGILLAIAAGFAFYFGIRYIWLKRSIREINRELAEITQQIEENRILKLCVPQREMEELLVTLNRTLEQVRAERIFHEMHEREFQRQLEDISHDLRTPLTAIQGYLKLIDKENLDREEREYLEVVQRRSVHLRHLINQFYEFSTLLSGNYKMELRRVDLGRMCREQLLGYYGQLESAGIEVRVCIPDTPVFIRADENALSRIIGNLLQNAVRYAKHRLVIEVRGAESIEPAAAEAADAKSADAAPAEAADMKAADAASTAAGKGRRKEAVLICANDAENLTGENVRQMFDRFYTGDPARSRGGTGLGLAVSRQLAEQMGGSMTAECRMPGDAPEEGSNTQCRWLVLKTVFQT